MSQLSFVYQDGTPEASSENKKIVRAHVSKYFHPKKQGNRIQRQNTPEETQLRRIAPHTQTELESFADSTGVQYDNIALQEDVLSYQLYENSISRVSTSFDGDSDGSCHAAVDDLLCFEKGLFKDGHIHERKGDRSSPLSRSNSGGGLSKKSKGKKVDKSITGTAKSVYPVNQDPDPNFLRTGHKSIVLRGPRSRSKSRNTNQKTRGFLSHLKREKAKSRSPSPKPTESSPRRSEETIVASVCPETQFLFDQYASRVEEAATLRNLVLSTLPLHTTYIPAARCNRTLWYASVAHSAAINQAFDGNPNDSSSLKYKGEVIKAINCNLRDLSTQLTDETIAAVVALASIELISGDIRAFALHLKATQEMVFLRGGLNSLGFDGLLSKLIQLHWWRWELVAQHAEETIPQLDRSHLQQQQNIPSESLLFTLKPQKANCRLASRPVSALFPILRDLAVGWDDQYCVASSFQFEKGCELLYDNVTAFSPQQTQEWTTNDYEFESFRLACQLYSDRSTEEEDFRAQHHYFRVQELQRCLQCTGMSSYWADFPGALIWCLAVGARESWGLAEYSWFMSHLFAMLTVLAMERWSELEATLNVFGWLFRCMRAGMVLAW